MSKPKVIFMGSKPGSVAALSILLERGWEVTYVVTAKERYQPWVAGTSLEELAVKSGLELVTQARLPREREVDFVISYMFRHLVKPDVLALARRAALNFHCAPLPDFGGYGCYNRAVLYEADSFGCTCHYMDEGFDTGALLKVRRFPIDAARETALSLEQRAQDEMVRLFHEFCDMAESGDELPRVPQDGTRGEYLTQPELDALKEIPAGADAATVDRYARAFWYPPYRGAFMRVGGLEVEVIPECVKDELARQLHSRSLERLLAVAGEARSTGRNLFGERFVSADQETWLTPA